MPIGGKIQHSKRISLYQILRISNECHGIGRDDPIKGLPLRSRLIVQSARAGDGRQGRFDLGRAIKVHGIGGGTFLVVVAEVAESGFLVNVIEAEFGVARDARGGKFEVDNDQNDKAG